jgi:hypothetical protein
MQVRKGVVESPERCRELFESFSVRSGTWRTWVDADMLCNDTLEHLGSVGVDALLDQTTDLPLIVTDDHRVPPRWLHRQPYPAVTTAQGVAVLIRALAP